MRRLVPSTLRTRLQLLVAAVVLATMAVMVVGVVHQRRIAVERAGEEARRLSQMAAAYDHQAVDGARQLLESLSHTGEVERLDGIECSRLFRQLLRDQSAFSTLSAARVDGRVFASSHALERPVEVGGTSWFERALRSRDLVIGGYQIGLLTGEPTFKCAFAARDSLGTPRAVLFVDMDLHGFSRLATRLRLPAEASLVVLDHSGVVVSRWPETREWIGRHFLSPQDVGELLARGEGDREVTGPDGIVRVTGFTAIGDPAQRAMIVGVGIPRTVVVSAASRELLASLLGLLLLGVVVLVAAGRVLDRFVVQPVESLVRVTRRVGRGDFDVRFPATTSRSEIGELARALEAMTRRLYRHRQRQARWAESVRASEARKTAIVGAALDAIFTFDDRGRVLEFNPAAERMFGRSAKSVLGQRAAGLVLPPGVAEPNTGHDAVLRPLRLPPGRVVETVALRADQTEFPVEVAITDVGLHDGHRHYTVFVRDISDRVRHEEALRTLSLVDPLTGLYNRRGFLTFAGQQLRLAERTGAVVTLLFADLDELKHVNDTYGHAAGDRAIRDAAQVLRDTFRESDVLGRLGGDEFAVLTLDPAGTSSGRLVSRLSRAADARNAEHPDAPPVHFSVGVVQRAPDDHTTFSELLRRGDELMYAHKRAKKREARVA